MLTVHNNENISDPMSEFYEVNQAPPFRILRNYHIVMKDKRKRTYYDAKKIPFCKNLIESLDLTDDKLIYIIKSPPKKILEVPVVGDIINDKYEVLQSSSEILIQNNSRSTGYVVLRHI